MLAVNEDARFSCSLYRSDGTPPVDTMIVDDIEVWVECDDERLDEYSTRVESQATRKIASCFIPSESGKVRTSILRVHGAYQYMCCTL